MIKSILTRRKESATPTWLLSVDIAGVADNDKNI
jgi:hypothetical protein